MAWGLLARRWCITLERQNQGLDPGHCAKLRTRGEIASSHPTSRGPQSDGLQERRSLSWQNGSPKSPTDSNIWGSPMKWGQLLQVILLARDVGTITHRCGN